VVIPWIPIIVVPAISAISIIPGVVPACIPWIIPTGIPGAIPPVVPRVIGITEIGVSVGTPPWIVPRGGPNTVINIEGIGRAIKFSQSFCIRCSLIYEIVISLFILQNI
jgi:hypothetical protein